MSAPLLEICQKCPAVYVCHVTPNSEMCQAVLNAIEAAATAHNTGMNAIALLEEMVVWLQAHSHFSLSPELLVWQQKSDLYCRMQQHHTRNVVQKF
jgi:hypothetical protein